MNQAYANNQYRNNQVMTAPQKKLIILLYDEGIRRLRLGELALENKEIQEVNTHLIKAQDIIAELMSTLNFQEGGDIAKNLYQLYDYMYLKLIRGNIDKNINNIREVRKLMEELREAWVQI